MSGVSATVWARSRMRRARNITLNDGSGLLSFPTLTHRVLTSSLGYPLHHYGY